MSSSPPAKSLTELAKIISDAAAEIEKVQTQPALAQAPSANGSGWDPKDPGEMFTSSKSVTDAKERLLSAVAEIGTTALSPQDFLLDLLFRVSQRYSWQSAQIPLIARRSMIIQH